MNLIAYTDGASRGNPGESGIGFIIKDIEGNVLCQGSGDIGCATNNVAEYSALLACLRKAQALGCTRLTVYSDSQLMVRQLLGHYRVKDKALRQYYERVQRILVAAPLDFEIIHIDREENREADRLANAGIASGRSMVNESMSA